MGISTYMSYCGAQIFEAVGLREGARRQVLHAAPRRKSRASACSRSPRKRSACTAPRSATTRCSQTCSTPAANTPGACAAKSTCGRPTRSPSCSTRARANTLRRPTRNTRSSSTTSRARHMTLRGLFEFKLDPSKADADRRGRAGGGDRQALRHRRDVARLDLDRGAHDARGRDEPHRRQVEHRRRRRGPGALPQRAEGHPDHRRHQGQRRDRRRASSRPTSRCKDGDSLRSKIKQVASGRFGVTAEYLASAPTSSRSRWRRAPSPARAASCPATRSPSTSR